MLVQPISASYKKRPADTISTGHGRLLYCPILTDFTGFLTDVPLRMSLLGGTYSAIPYAWNRRAASPTMIYYL